MSSDKYQAAWQAQASQTRLTLHAGLLRGEVLRNRRTFRTTILMRDIREIGVALVMIPVWFYLGIAHSSPWTWWLGVPALLWVAGFMLAYRRRRPHQPSAPDEPLVHCVKTSLAEVEDQIWLLRNVFWWYLLPPSIAITAFFAHVTMQAPIHTPFDMLGRAGTFLLLSAFLAAIYGFIYWLNQRAVRKQLEPRRQELLMMLASLEEETAGAPGDGPATPVLPGSQVRDGQPAANPPDRPVSASGYAKVAPYTDVRWEHDRPVVMVDGQWSPLVSIDGIPIEKIMEFANEEFGTLAHKRFGEDLVELLSKMGHDPDWTVTLGLEREQGRVEEMRVQMTEENRRRVRN